MKAKPAPARKDEAPKVKAKSLKVSTNVKAGSKATGNRCETLRRKA